MCFMFKTNTKQINKMAHFRNRNFDLTNTYSVENFRLKSEMKFLCENGCDVIQRKPKSALRMIVFDFLHIQKGHRNLYRMNIFIYITF